MILFIILALIIVVLVVIAVIALTIGGVVGIILFSDIIVCVFLITKVMNKMMRRR